ncbi:hypothetical protein ONE63_009152 [Megalurothrips usitatus]|uniref:Uncharacterized protein n=1 Tax=Megalurothrips usitatus TaxID=439358 RepID=A0AAV7XNG4_9NEOP|nr:hypothetical protein ONE63_009152 [Megalurothrips usitatus]
MPGRPPPTALVAAAVLAVAAAAAAALLPAAASAAPGRTLNLALIAPAADNNDRNLPHILPAMDLAIKDVGASVLPGWDITLRYRDSNCSSTHGPLAAFDFVMNKTVGEYAKKSICSIKP